MPYRADIALSLRQSTRAIGAAYPVDRNADTDCCERAIVGTNTLRALEGHPRRTGWALHQMGTLWGHHTRWALWGHHTR